MTHTAVIITLYSTECLVLIQETVYCNLGTETFNVTQITVSLHPQNRDPVRNLYLLG